MFEERYVQRYFGPAAHLLTMEEAWDMESYLPLTFHCLLGPGWFEDDEIDTRPHLVVRTITLTRLSENVNEMEAFSVLNPLRVAYRLREDDDHWRQPLCTESESNQWVSRLNPRGTTNPVYLFYADEPMYVAARGPPDAVVNRASWWIVSAAVNTAASGGRIFVCRPLPLREVTEQLPKWFLLPTDRTIAATMASEARVRGIFGPAARRLTEGLCVHRLAPHLPLTMLGVCGRAWYDNRYDDSAEEDTHENEGGGMLLRHLVRLTLKHWDADRRVLRTSVGDAQFDEVEFDLDTDDSGTMVMRTSAEYGRGGGPVYVFLSIVW